MKPPTSRIVARAAGAANDLPGQPARAALAAGLPGGRRIGGTRCLASLGVAINCGPRAPASRILAGGAA